MDILYLKFEEPHLLTIDGHKVEIVVFETTEASNVKFGINAPSVIGVDREEIYIQKKQRENTTKVSTSRRII